MQVTERAAEGLKRAFAITVPAARIIGLRDERLAEIARTVPVSGYRRGEVPWAVVMQRFGASVLGEVLEEQVTAATGQLITDRALRPAQPPKVEVGAFAEDRDLVIGVAIELLPEVPLPDLAGLRLERLRARPSGLHLDRALERLAARHGTLEEVAARPATRGEILLCDIEGGLPADLLANGPGLGARAGKPGLAPSQWSLDTSPGLVCEVTATGHEDGLPCLDVTLRGTAGPDGFLRIFPAQPKGLRAAPGQVLTLCMRARILGGALPANATVRLGFNERSETDFLRSIRSPAVPGRGEMRATFAVGDNPALAYARPLLDLGFRAGTVVAVTLRLGPARVFAGAEEPEAMLFGGGRLAGAEIEIGGPAVAPRFSDQLEGMAPGETRIVEAMLPADHPVSELANRRARYAVTARGLKRRRPLPTGGELARAVGLTDAEALKAAVLRSLQREYDAWSGRRLKVQLLDHLAAAVSFPLPEGLVTSEAAQIWQRMQAEPRHDAAGRDAAALRAECLRLAERRIRLRLLIARIAEARGVQLSEEEVAQAIRRDAARYPGQERQVLDFYRGNAAALEGLRAPLIEQKVVDLLVADALVTEREVMPEELGAV
jgi:FKBP-type peptidyl-prolyl cis-trans isomerase (trigger factor)